MEHYKDIVSAQGICDALNRESFGASIEHDFATETVSTSAFVTTILQFDNSENVSTGTLTDYLNALDASQMETFLVDVLARKITVVHNPLLLSAQDIVNALAEKTGVHTEISLDGAEHLVWDFPEAIEEKLIEPESARLRPTIVLAGIFWIISMLSFIGDKW